MTDARLIQKTHRCIDHLDSPYGKHGDIYECCCGKWWRAIEPGNPDYNKWRRAWIRQLFSRKVLSDDHGAYTNWDGSGDL